MFETISAIMMLIVFRVPGYIWRTVKGQMVYLDRRLEWQKFALGLLTRSTIVYLPWSPLLYRVWTGKWYDTHPRLTAALAVVFLLLLPTIQGFIFGCAKQENWFHRAKNHLIQRGVKKSWPKWIVASLNFNLFEKDSVPTAWDSLFSEPVPCWVIATLKDVSKVCA